MATHPRTKADGGPTRLHKLLAYHEGAAAAIRLTMELLNGAAKVAKTNGHATVLADAVALDEQRVATTTAKTKKRINSGDATRAKLAIRERTARVLALVAEQGPMTADVIADAVGGGRVGLTPLTNAGYLKRLSDGRFKRTAKPFTADWRTAQG